MDYYKKIQDATLWIEEKINENIGGKIPIINLKIKFRRVYGFGNKLLFKILQDYEELGLIVIEDKLIKVKKNKGVLK